MFNEKLLESSEFYTKRYQNFTTLIIFPTLILLVLLILLACLTHKETVIKSTGEIAPIKILSTIQSTSNNPIIKNELLTKKEITAGDILIQYQNTESDTNLQLQKSALKNLQEHVRALTVYKDSIKQDQNLFTAEDNYGCATSYQSYLAQRRSLTTDHQQQINNQDSIKQQKKMIAEAISKKDSELSQYQNLINAIINNTSLSPKNAYYNDFLDYQHQITELSASQVDKFKKETVTSIQQQINSINDTLTSYKTQYAGFSSTDLTEDTLTNKLNELKSQQLTSIIKELEALNQEIDQTQIQCVATETSGKNTIIANESGTVNLLINKTKLTSIPQGTNLAQIYPKLKTMPELKVSFYVSANEISEIVENQSIRYHLAEKNSKRMVISGNITNISANPMTTKDGNFYQVGATLNLHAKDYQNIHYGQTGTVSIITGKSTWISYIKNTLIHQ
ncbi:bacteriocin secretion accessory protein [Leuconostoc mesenteroides]